VTETGSAFVGDAVLFVVFGVFALAVFAGFVFADFVPVDFVPVDFVPVGFVPVGFLGAPVVEVDGADVAFVVSAPPDVVESAALLGSALTAGSCRRRGRGLRRCHRRRR
jgi:hypothetical protein